MTAPRIRADHDQLLAIATQFKHEEDAVGRLVVQLKQPLEILRGGDWVGRSATSFYAEMDQGVLPGLQRLRRALERAGETAKRLSARMRQAEADAATILRDRTAFAGRATPSGTASLSSALDVLSQIGGFFWDVLAGGAAELGDMVMGLISLVSDPGAALEGLWYGVTHPDQLWAAFTQPYVEDWNNGHPGRAIGRGIVFVGSFLLGTKGAEKAARAGSLTGKVAEVSEVAGRVGKLGDVAGEAGKLGDLASGLGRVGQLSLPRWMAEISESFARLPKPVQASRDLSELMQAATASRPALSEITERLAALTGGRAEIAPLKFATQTGLDRITEKVASYAGDASQIKDLVRSRIVFNSLDEVYSAVKTVANEIDIVGYKDRFLKPVESGFRDILINLKLPNGHIGELRLSTETIETIAAIEHPIYEQVRTIRDAAKAASRELTFAEATQIDEMLAPFRPMYDNAYLDLLRTTWSGLSGSSP